MRNILWSSLFVFAFETVCSAQSVVYFPQIADGIQGSTRWTSGFAITNTAAPGTSTASATLTFTQDNGTPLNVSLFDQQGSLVGTGNSFPFQLSGGQMRIYFTNGASALSQGFATLSSNVPLTGGALFFEFALSGNLISQAGVLPATPLTKQTMFAIQDPSDSTAVAVANPGTATATITFQLLDNNGQSFASVIKTVGALNHTALFVNQLFPTLPDHFFGTLRMTSDVAVVTTGLLFISGGQFATLPVFPLP